LISETRFRGVRVMSLDSAGCSGRRLNRRRRVHLAEPQDPPDVRELQAAGVICISDAGRAEALGYNCFQWGPRPTGRRSSRSWPGVTFRTRESNDALWARTDCSGWKAVPFSTFQCDTARPFTVPRQTLHWVSLTWSQPPAAQVSWAVLLTSLRFGS